MQHSFFKYAGCGNDFIVFDDRTQWFPIHHLALIQRLCHRQYGIGADGILLLQHSSRADFRMRIFNSDGTEAEMCGNGIRCLAKFLSALGYRENSYQIETFQHVLTISYQGEDVCVQMNDPTDLQWNITLAQDHHQHQIHFMNTGVPHAVLFVDDADQTPLNQLGPWIRRHPLFSPKGTNVNIAQCLGPRHFKIRTYERGVEAETLACGTGATAVALAAAYHYQINAPIVLQTASQEKLIIGFHRQDQTFSNVTMTGPAQLIYQGNIQISDPC